MAKIDTINSILMMIMLIFLVVVLILGALFLSGSVQNLTEGLRNIKN